MVYNIMVENYESSFFYTYHIWKVTKIIITRVHIFRQERDHYLRGVAAGVLKSGIKRYILDNVILKKENLTIS